MADKVIEYVIRNFDKLRMLDTKTKPNTDILIQHANFLGVSLGYLLDTIQIVWYVKRNPV